MDGNQPSAGLWSIAEREERLLAPYAMRGADSRGRRRPETEHPYRGPFQRDRDRVLHCAAFRRLSGKMQVFTGERGDYHRTRLTHTHEVASIARTIGRALRLNEDLVEALALFHDIGHPPFGHAGEDALNECLAEHGGFSHNQFALTLAEDLEQRHSEFPGLNLTEEVLEGQRTRVKHGKSAARLLEVQVVDIADSITYDAHDTDDAVKLGLVALEELSQLPLVRETLRFVRARSPRLDGNLLRKALVHDLIDRQVSAVLEHAGPRLAASGFATADEARHSDFRLGPDAALAEEKAELERFLYKRVYRHPELLRVRAVAQQQLMALFEVFRRDAAKLPVRYQRRAEQVGIERSIGDYLAGMTDRFCDQQYQQLVLGSSGA